ncbi:MAG: ABC-F family ATP-binding cassette domain-containing protein [Deltaproteobacteria bacterium]|nr:ABC-F family ATP-binding cassette domain-containing protein [Deltaproteobacteria bacterium]
MPVIGAQGLCKNYGERVVLDAVDLTLTRGERVGLIGPNGCGKSTLARILAAEEDEDDGKITTRRLARVVYLPQTPIPTAPTVGEEVQAGLGPWKAAHARFDAVNTALAELSAGPDSGTNMEALLAEQEAAQVEIERLGGYDKQHEIEALALHLSLPPLDREIATLSGGEVRRVALARLLLAKPDLAILDEPTNHLDLQTIEWLQQHLAETFTGAVLLITHDRAFLDGIVDRTLELDAGALYSYPGGYENYLEGRAERLAQQAREEDNRQRFVRQELQWLRRQPKARSTKQKARVQRAESAIQKTAPAKEGKTRLALDSTRLGKTILELRGVTVNVPGGSRPLLRNLDFILTRGKRVGIVGPNGCGKTTLLRVISGELEPEIGEVVRGKNTRISYLSQTRDQLDEEATIWENIAGERGVVTIGGREVGPHSYLERFLFRGEVLRQPVKALSGGERTRVALARLLAQPANLLILDEPTNDLDIATIRAMEQLLLEFRGTALVVTHDRYFLNRVATSLLAFVDDEVRHLSGGFAQHRAELLDAWRPRRRDDKPSAPPAPSPSAASVKEAKPRGPKLTYGERLEFEKLEPRVEALEGEIKALEGQLADPALYQGHGERVPEIQAKLEALNTEHETLFMRWSELEEKREASAG